MSAELVVKAESMNPSDPKEEYILPDTLPACYNMEIIHQIKDEPPPYMF